MTHFIAIQILTALTLVMASTPIGSAELQRYVTADDPVYRWEHVAQTSPQEGLVVHELRLISHVWQGDHLAAPPPDHPPSGAPRPALAGPLARHRHGRRGAGMA